MTTTPTLWGNEVTISNFFTDFAPKVKALSDGTFAIVWQRTGGDMSAATSTSRAASQAATFSPRCPARPPMRSPTPSSTSRPMARSWSTTPSSPSATQRDVRWHEVEQSRAERRLGRHGGSADCRRGPLRQRESARNRLGTRLRRGQSGPAQQVSDPPIRRFLNGTPSSERIFLDLDHRQGRAERGRWRANLNGVVVAYEQFDKTTFDRQINLQVFQYNPVLLLGRRAGQRSRHQRRLPRHHDAQQRLLCRHLAAGRRNGLSQLQRHRDPGL